MGAFQIVAGWWGHQPGQSTVGGVATAHSQKGKRQFEMHPIKLLSLSLRKQLPCP